MKIKYNAYIAEFIGTFILLFAGCGAVVANKASDGAVTHVGIALTFGLVVMAMIHAVGDVSGAHLNPAVTVAFWTAGRFEAKKIPGYVASQTLGAIAACYLLLWLYPGVDGYGATVPGPNLCCPFKAFVIEFILTFILMLVIINVATGSKEKGIVAGLAIGGTVALLAMFGGPMTGASMNPARSLAPALVEMNFNALWPYLTAPFLGACAAIYFCHCRSNGESCNDC